MKGHGTLVVENRLRTELLKTVLPIEVRDARFKLVSVIKDRGELSLEAGLYSVSALREDGTSDVQSVEVEKDTRTTVTFESPEIERDFALDSLPDPIEALQETEFETIVHNRDRLDRKWTDKHRVIDDVYLFAASPSIEIAAARNGSVWTRAEVVDAPVSFAAHSEPPMPWVAFASRDEIVCVSVFAGEETRPCGMRVSVADGAPTGGRLRVDLDLSADPALGVLVSFVERGNTSEASALAEQILAGDDPIAAAYAALVLHRFGAVVDRDRIEELQESARWLTDLSILRATLLHDRFVDRGFQMLRRVATSDQPLPIWSDAYSLMVSMLRRHARRHESADKEERERATAAIAALDSLHEITTHFDFGSTSSLLRWRS
jgi:hypothetical protein